jgi:FemAB-related protein (PEP-CTERM system-associated)
MRSVLEHAATAEVTVGEYSPRVRRAWDEWLRRNGRATPFHSTAWMQSLERSFGYESRSLYAERAGTITGVLPLFLVSNWVVGRCLISTPFADYGGICAEDEATWNALVERAKEMAIAERVDFLELRHREATARPEFKQKDLYVGFSCELESDPEVQLKKLPRDTRYMIRKGQKAGFEVRSGLDQLRTFYQLFTLNWHRFGTPVFSSKWLGILAEEFSDSIDLTLLYREGQAIEGVLSLFSADTAFPHYVGARPEANRYAANNFIYWHLMNDAVRRGLHRFDFGRSKRGTGAYEFKSSWNMRMDTLGYQTFLVRRKEAPNFSPTNPKFEIATRLWKGMPLKATTWLGPRVIRWFP